MPKTAASGEAIESMSMDEFKQHVVDFIGNNSLNEAELGQCVLHLQKANGWKSTGKSSLNKALGVPVNQTYRDTIKGHFSNEVIVSIEHDVATYSLSPVALEQYMKRTQNSVANQPQSQLTVSDFDLLICSLIGDRVVLSSVLGVFIRQYKRTNQWPDVGKSRSMPDSDFLKNNLIALRSKNIFLNQLRLSAWAFEPNLDSKIKLDLRTLLSKA